MIDYRDGVLTQICGALGEDFQLDAQASFEILTGTLRNILTYKPTKFEIEFSFIGRASAAARRNSPDLASWRLAFNRSRMSFGFCTLLTFHPRSTPEGGSNAERNPYRLVYNLEQWLDFDATLRILFSHAIPTECILSWLLRTHLSKRLLL